MNIEMNVFVENILQFKFYACCYILLSVAISFANFNAADETEFNFASLMLSVN